MDIIGSLNGSVYSQGIQVDCHAWLDMGSEEWERSSEKQKAAAYQAAKVCGWTNAGLKSIMMKEFGPRIDDFMADVTIEALEEFAKKYPIEIEVVKEVSDQTIFKSGDEVYRLP